MKPNNLVHMLKRTVDKYSNKVAIMWKEDGAYKSITYGEFWQRIHYAASGFWKLGVKDDDKVAILSDSNPMWGITDFALASIGAVSVPVYTTLPPESIAFILKNADVKGIVVENEELRQKVLDSGVELQFMITMYPDANFSPVENELTFSQLEEDGKNNLFPNWEDYWMQIDRDKVVTIIHTSGTTGVPKGAMLTHENFLANLEGVQFWLIELLPADVSLSYLPLSHVFERMAGHYMQFYVGTTVAYAESIDTIQENLQEIRPTVFTSVPRLFEKVYALVYEQINKGTFIRKKVFKWALKVGMERYEMYVNSPINELILGDAMPKSFKRKWKIADRLVYQKVKQRLGGRIRGMVSGGGTLNPEIAKFFWALDLPILEGYGLTETAPVITTNPMVRAKPGTVGKVLPNLEVKIAPDGEVLVRGPSIMKGYYNDEETTKNTFDGDWFLTGDLGTIDEDGYLKIIGRKKRILVLSTGKNVSPQIVESSVNESAFVDQSVLVGDKQKYVIILIHPDFEVLEEWARKKNIRYDSFHELVKDPQVINKYDMEVKQHTKKLANFERPKKVVLVGDQWSIETGELTPKLSVKTAVIEEKYKDVIKETYGEDYLDYSETFEKTVERL